VTKTYRKEEIGGEDLSQMGSICAWDGCEEQFQGDMPPDWRWMLVYWDPRPAADQTVAEVSLGQFCDRDAALCPKHKDELEASLKDIGRWAKEPAGRA